MNEDAMKDSSEKEDFNQVHSILKCIMYENMNRECVVKFISKSELELNFEMALDSIRRQCKNLLSIERERHSLMHEVKKCTRVFMARWTSNVFLFSKSC